MRIFKQLSLFLLFLMVYANANAIWRVTFAIPVNYSYSGSVKGSDKTLSSTRLPFGFASSLEIFKGFSLGYEYYTQNIKYGVFSSPKSVLTHSFFMANYAFYTKKMKYVIGLSSGNADFKFTDEVKDYTGNSSLIKINLQVGYRFDTALDFVLGLDLFSEYSTQMQADGNDEFKVNSSGTMVNVGATYGF